MENFWDSIEMMRNSTPLCVRPQRLPRLLQCPCSTGALLAQGMLFAFCVIVFFYNVFCIYVTFLLDSIWHAILDNFRPVRILGFLCWNSC